MRVAYDSRPVEQRSGVGRYARSLLEALRRRDDVEIVETTRGTGVDVYHSPWQEGALLRPIVPMVVSLHGLHTLGRSSDHARSGFRHPLRSLAVQRSTRVITPTAAVAADVETVLAIAAEHIVVIPEAAAPVFHPRDADEVAAVRARLRLPEDYLLWVGGLRVPDPRRRIVPLAHTPRTLPLVLVGPAGRWARELEGVIVTGGVSDDELAAIYTGARALVLPSGQEGYALPVIEALACGTPVAACDVAGVRELAPEGVALCPPGDLDALVAAAEQLTRPAPAPPSFSWDDVAAATVEVYAQAAATPVRFRGARRQPRRRS